MLIRSYWDYINLTCFLEVWRDLFSSTTFIGKLLLVARNRCHKLVKVCNILYTHIHINRYILYITSSTLSEVLYTTVYLFFHLSEYFLKLYLYYF